MTTCGLDLSESYNFELPVHKVFYYVEGATYASLGDSKIHYSWPLLDTCV